MAKKSGGKSSKPASKKSTDTAEHHRKMAHMYSAKARIHGAKADLAEALNPPKNKGPYFGSGC